MGFNFACMHVLLAVMYLLSDASEKTIKKQIHTLGVEPRTYWISRPACSTTEPLHHMIRMEINARVICAIQFHECLIHVGYFMKVGSQAKGMRDDDSITTITKGQRLICHTT